MYEGGASRHVRGEDRAGQGGERFWKQIPYAGTQRQGTLVARLAPVCRADGLVGTALCGVAAVRRWRSFGCHSHPSRSQSRRHAPHLLGTQHRNPEGKVAVEKQLNSSKNKKKE